MADFDIPFANTGSRRSPTADEKAQGFPCGPADQTLFNGMFHRIEAELGDLINYAGLAGSDADYSQVRQAILTLINAATGGGSTTDYVLLSQATSRMPIYPEVLTTDGRINFTAPATGTVRMPGGINFLHRGIALLTTAQTDFATVANKTYHLRWSPTGGFVLQDFADTGYSGTPGLNAESSALFDSTYDNMILARIVTNSSNVATITSLANKATLTGFFSQEYTFANVTAHGGSAHAMAPALAINWARAPQMSIARMGISATSPVAGTLDVGNTGTNISTISRYDIRTAVQAYNPNAAAETMTCYYAYNGRA